MLKKLSFTLAAAGLIFSASAYATASNGLYLGLQLGESSADYSNSSSGLSDFYGYSSLPGASVDNNAFAGRLYLGYQFNKFVAAELGYSYLGNVEFNNIFAVSGATASLRQQAGDLTAKVMLPVTRQFNVFALGGVAYVGAKPNDVSNTASLLGVQTGSREGAFTATYGLGAGYDFNQHWGLDATWRRFNSSGDIENTDLFTLGAAYHFG
ncbi:MAG: outer membrane beta-barrel protein [Gammaproteobacteria bacterium]